MERQALVGSPGEEPRGEQRARLAWKTKARTRQLLLFKTINTFALIGFVRLLVSAYRTTFAPQRTGSSSVLSCRAVAALIVSCPPTVSPRPGALPSRGGRRQQIGSLERVAKKRSESAQLISAVKTDTGGALLDCTHFFSSSKSKALSVIRDGTDSGDAWETILHSG